MVFICYCCGGFLLNLLLDGERNMCLSKRVTEKNYYMSTLFNYYMSAFFLANLFTNRSIYCFEQARRKTLCVNVFRELFPLNLGKVHWVFIEWNVQSLKLRYNDS